MRFEREDPRSMAEPCSLGQTHWSTTLRNPDRIIRLTVGATLGAIVVALISCSDGCSFNDVIKATIVGSVVGASLTVICWIIEIWNPLKLKCDVCGSTNLEPWDEKHDRCLDCEAANFFWYQLQKTLDQYQAAPSPSSAIWRFGVLSIS